jgi:hypothetical protein
MLRGRLRWNSIGLHTKEERMKEEGRGEKKEGGI